MCEREGYSLKKVKRGGKSSKGPERNGHLVTSFVLLRPAVTKARNALGYSRYRSQWMAFRISHFSCITSPVLFKQKKKSLTRHPLMFASSRSIHSSVRCDLSSGLGRPPKALALSSLLLEIISLVLSGALENVSQSPFFQNHLIP